MNRVLYFNLEEDYILEVHELPLTDNNCGALATYYIYKYVMYNYIYVSLYISSHIYLYIYWYYMDQPVG